MIRRTLIPIVCVTAFCALAIAYGFLALNFMRLAEAESVVSDFVHQAVDAGPASRLSAYEPSQAETRMLARARQIGPLAAIEQSACAAQADAVSLCAGQLLACQVQGRGENGAFEADVDLSRRGDLDHYHLARSIWRFRFDGDEPIEPVTQSPI